MSVDEAIPGVPPDGATIGADSPWPGLLAFRETDSGYFQGRQTETEDLLRLVVRERLTVLFGLSGLGKSSLLQAGLFPRLRREQIFPVYIRLDFSSERLDLVAQVRTAIANEATTHQIEVPLATGEETLWEYFHRAGNNLWNARNRPVMPLMVFDQFEEIFTLGRLDSSRTEAADALLDQLADLVEGRPPAALKTRMDEHPEETSAFSFGRHHYKVLLGIREDFLPDLEALRPRMPSVVLNRLRLRRLNGEAAVLVVNQAPHLIEAAVAEQVVRFVAADRRALPLVDLEVEPALLSVVCRELNGKRRELDEPKITAGLLEGNQEQVLADFYERSTADLPSEVRYFIEDHLLTVSGFRDSAALENALSTPGVSRQALDLLVKRRLVRVEDRGGVQRLELTHDLLTRVVRARRDSRWQREEAEKQRLALAHAQEQQQQALRRAQEELERLEAEQSARERELQHAHALAETQRQRADEQQSARLKQRRLNVALTVLLIVAASSAGVVLLQRGLVERKEKAAIFARVAVTSAVVLSSDPELSMLIALKALDAPEVVDAGGVSDLADVLSRSMSVSRIRARVTVADGKKRLRLVSYSADGSMLATEGAGNTVVVRDGDDGRPMYPEIAHDTAVEALAFSPTKALLDNPGVPQDLLATASGKTVSIRSPDDPRVLRTLLHEEPVAAADFSHDGLRLATAQTDGVIQVWNVRSGAVLTTPAKMRHEYVNSLSFNSSGVSVATSSGDGSITVWNASTGKERFDRIEALEPQVVRLSPDGRFLASGGTDSVVTLWDASDGSRLQTLFGHTNTVFSVAFSADSRRIVTASADGTVRIYDTETGRQLGVLRGSKEPLVDVAFGPDKNNVATVGWDGAVRVWSVRGLVDFVDTTAFSADGSTLLTANRDGTVPLWNADTGNALAYGYVHQASSIALNGDGSYMATGKQNGEVELWRGTQLEHTLTGHGPKDSIAGLAFSANGKRLASLSKNVAFVWSVETGQKVGEMQHKFVHGPAVALSPDGSFAATSDESGEIKLWTLKPDATSGVVLRGYPAGQVNKLVFSPNGQWLACAGSDGTVRLWNVAGTPGEARTFEHGAYVFDVAFNRDSTRLVSAGMDGMAKLWVFTSPNQQPIVLRGHTGAIETASFSADGVRIATGSWDRTVRIWDAATGSPLTTLSHEREVKDVMFSRDGGRLTAVSIDGVVRVHLFDVEKLKTMARERLTRQLTAEECDQYLRGIACP